MLGYPPTPPPPGSLSMTGAARVRPTGGWWVRADLDMWAASAHMEWYRTGKHNSTAKHLLKRQAE